MRVALNSIFNFLLAESSLGKRVERQVSEEGTEATDISISTGEFCNDLGIIEKRIIEWRQKNSTFGVALFDVNMGASGKTLNVEISPANEAKLSEFLSYFESLKDYLKSDSECIPKGSVSAIVHIPKWPLNTVYARQIKTTVMSAFRQGHVSANVKMAVEKDLAMKIDDLADLKMNGLKIAPPHQISDVFDMSMIDSDYQKLAAEITEEGHRKLDDHRAVVIFERPMGYYGDLIVDDEKKLNNKDEWTGGEASVERRVAQEVGFNIGMYIRDTRLKMIRTMSSFIKKVRGKIGSADKPIIERLDRLEKQINDLYRQVDAVDMTEHPKVFDALVFKMDAEVRALAEEAKKLVLKMDAERATQAKVAEKQALSEMNAEAMVRAKEAIKDAERIFGKDKRLKEEDTGDVLVYDKMYFFPWAVLSFSMVSPDGEEDSIEKPCVTLILVPRSLNISVADIYAQVRKNSEWRTNAMEQKEAKK